jgi:valyl-tRNA synthetase
MGEVMEITTAIRGLRAEMGLGTQPVSVSLHYGSGDRERIERVRPYVGHLAHLEAGRLQLGGLDEHPPFGIPSPCGAGRIEIHVDSDELRGRVRERFQKQLGSIEQELAGVTKRLQDPVFRQKAPAETVEATGARASELSARRNTLRRYVADLGVRGPA